MLHAFTITPTLGKPSYDHRETSNSSEIRDTASWSDGYHSEANLTITNTLTTTTGWDAETAGTSTGGTGVTSTGGTAPTNSTPAAPVGNPVVTYSSDVWVSSSDQSAGSYSDVASVIDTSETHFANGATEKTRNADNYNESGGEGSGQLSDDSSFYSRSQILANGTVIAIDHHDQNSTQIGDFNSLQQSTIEQHAPNPTNPNTNNVQVGSGVVILLAPHDPQVIGNGDNSTTRAAYTWLLTNDVRDESGTITHISTDQGTLTTTGTPIPGWVAPLDDPATPEIDESEDTGYTYSTSGTLHSTELHERNVADGDLQITHSTEGVYKQWSVIDSSSKEHFVTITDGYYIQLKESDATGPRLLTSTFAENTKGTGSAKDRFTQQTNSTYLSNGEYSLDTTASSESQEEVTTTGHGEWNDPLSEGISQSIHDHYQQQSISMYAYTRSEGWGSRPAVGPRICKNRNSPIRSL